MGILFEDEEEERAEGFARGVEREREADREGAIEGIIGAFGRVVEDYGDDMIMSDAYNEGKEAGERYTRKHR